MACVQVHGPFDTSQPPRRLFAALLLTLAYVTALFTRHEHAIVLNYVTWTHLSNTYIANLKVTLRFIDGSPYPHLDHTTLAGLVNLFIMMQLLTEINFFTDTSTT